MIESLLTHQNPLVRQLIKGLLKLGYENTELVNAGNRLLFEIEDIRFQFWDEGFSWRKNDWYVRYMRPTSSKIIELLEAIKRSLTPLDRMHR